MIVETIIGKQFANKVIPLIKNTKREINIVVFDWKWYPDQIGSEIQRFNNALVDASKRGKIVKAITNSHDILKRVTDIKIKVKNLPSKRLLHTKLMIIDNDIVVIGSHNYTMNAFTINHELSIIIYDKETASETRGYFQNLWQL